MRVRAGGVASLDAFLVTLGLVQGRTSSCFASWELIVFETFFFSASRVKFERRRELFPLLLLWQRLVNCDTHTVRRGHVVPVLGDHVFVPVSRWVRLDSRSARHLVTRKGTHHVASGKHASMQLLWIGTSA